MVNAIIAQVEEVLSPVYLVGGSVRDLLRGSEPKDYDFATPLSPDEIEQQIRKAGKRPFVTGKRFGTVGFKMGEHFVEVTTFRSESYGHTRKPTVEFVSDITRDLSRRDFTINAVALRHERFIDPFGGREDLQKRMIRSVGNPALRFNEDPLRMLRAARLAAELDFRIDDKTLRAMRSHGRNILRVSHERWMTELDRLLVAQRPEVGLKALVETDLIKYLVPELRLQVGYDQNSPYHNLTLWEHSVSTMLRVPKDVTLRWAALLHDVGKPFTRIDKADRSNYVDHDVVGAMLARGIARRLRWSNERTETVVRIIEEHLKDEHGFVAQADGLSTQTKASSE